MHNWLQNYAYHIDISWWIFFSAGFVAILIALITVSFQAVKAAVANPDRRRCRPTRDRIGLRNRMLGSKKLISFQVTISYAVTPHIQIFVVFEN